MLLTNPVVGASCLFRRSVLDSALPFPPPVGVVYHDRWIALVASLLGGIAYVDRPLYDYVQHPGAVLGHTATVEPGGQHGESRLDRSVAATPGSGSATSTRTGAPTTTFSRGACRRQRC